MDITTCAHCGNDYGYDVRDACYPGGKEREYAYCPYCNAEGPSDVTNGVIVTEKAKQYHKLVRDRIPEIIKASGKVFSTETLSDEDYLKMLDAKLDEELAEYHQDQNLEELADLLEVLYACAIARGYSLEALEEVRAKKALERGGFEKKILLKSVIGN